MHQSVTQYYRCPERYTRIALSGTASSQAGYFGFGAETICYGQGGGGSPSTSPQCELYDAVSDTRVGEGQVRLAFDLEQVVENLRLELYSGEHNNGNGLKSRALAKAYYLVRPLLPLGIRKHMQKWRLRGWDQLPFPRWPVDWRGGRLLRDGLLWCLKS